MTRAKGFTLVELMVVVLIVGILAAVAVPMMSGRVDQAKWSEANAAAGMIRSQVRVLYSQDPNAAVALVGNSLDDGTTQTALGFGSGDLSGTYFESDDYTITSVSQAAGSEGLAAVTVTGGSKSDSPTGSYVLAADGSWTKQ